MAATIEFTPDEIAKATKFAKDVATYNRREVDTPEQRRNNRVGKLGEIAFGNFLEEHEKKRLGDEDMFTVWSGTRRVDKRDFLTADGKTIDIKTSSRDFHTRILVPYDQYEDQPKDYYVSVHISENETTGTIKGYAIYGELRKKMRGTYLSYEIDYRDLHPIEELLEMIPDASES